MPYTRDEKPLSICSEKVQDHGSPSRVRSLTKRILGLFKPPPELHTSTLKNTPQNPHAQEEQPGEGTDASRIAQPPYLGCRGLHKRLRQGTTTCLKRVCCLRNDGWLVVFTEGSDTSVLNSGRHLPHSHISKNQSARTWNKSATKEI